MLIVSLKTEYMFKTKKLQDNAINSVWFILDKT